MKPILLAVLLATTFSDAPTVKASPVAPVAAPEGSEVQVIRSPRPEYPEAALQLGVQANCQVRFYIDELGVPYDVKMVDCPPIFHDAVLAVVWDWRFEPMEENGVPVKATFTLNIRFAIAPPAGQARRAARRARRDERRAARGG